jgi:hypothetical protein
MNTRCYPRTLEQAFGPYHRSSVCPVEPMPEPMHADDKVVILASLAALIALIVIFTYEWNWL